jgi:small subunit ribosomal protein S20
MPIIASAKKRVRTTRKAASRNRKMKREVKSALKLFIKSPGTKSSQTLQGRFDIAVKKGVIHKNKAARLKARAAAHAKAAGVKPAVKAAAKSKAAKTPKKG